MSLGEAREVVVEVNNGRYGPPVARKGLVSMWTPWAPPGTGRDGWEGRASSWVIPLR